MDKLKVYIDANDGTSVIQLMSSMVKITVAKTEAVQKKFLDPLNKQERDLKVSFQIAFDAALRGTETKTGLLKSIRDIHLAQEEGLETIGLSGLREKINEETANVSNQINDLITKGRNGEKTLDELTATIDEIVTKLNEQL